MVNKWQQQQQPKQPSEAQILGWIMVILRTSAVVALANQKGLSLADAARTWFETEAVIDKAAKDFVQEMEAQKRQSG